MRLALLLLAIALLMMALLVGYAIGTSLGRRDRQKQRAALEKGLYAVLTAAEQATITSSPRDLSLLRMEIDNYRSSRALDS